MTDEQYIGLLFTITLWGVFISFKLIDIIYLLKKPLDKGESRKE